MNLHTVFKAGLSGLGFGLVSISLVFLAGSLLQKILGIRKDTSLLVTTGTAICGGSAIAAVSSVIDAEQEDVSVAVGTVFLLNAVGLLIFPPLGHLFHLNGEQFGTWSGIAIHDVSSVVGAASAFGQDALGVATAVKLSRVLYLVPITLMISYRKARHASGIKRAGPPIPWFVLGFLVACALRSGIPALEPWSPIISRVARMGFSLSLYLIGSGITRAALKKVGVRPLIQGAALWVFISVLSLAAVIY